jgi:hypothetical protein
MARRATATVSLRAQISCIHLSKLRPGDNEEWTDRRRAKTPPTADTPSDVSYGSRAAVADRRMAQPVYPQLRKYPVRSAHFRFVPSSGSPVGNERRHHTLPLAGSNALVDPALASLDPLE